MQTTNSMDTALRYLQQMSNYILKYNYFKFNDKFYLQIHGTATGTTFALNYFKVYLGDFENYALQNAPNDLQPLVCKRFIDDIFIFWTHGEETLLEFYNYIKNLHPTIKFDNTHSTKEVNFLDTTIYFNNQVELGSKLYVEPTDTCGLLPA